MRKIIITNLMSNSVQKYIQVNGTLYRNLAEKRHSIFLKRKKNVMLENIKSIVFLIAMKWQRKKKKDGRMQNLWLLIQ